MNHSKRVRSPRPAKTLQAARDGIAAVEFAIVAPILIAMFFGLLELSTSLNCGRQVTNMASSAANLVAQSAEVNNAAQQNIFAAATSILYPNPPADATIVISSVIDDGQGGAKVSWSDASAGAARPVNSIVVVPSGLLPKNGSVILAEVTYTYRSPLSIIIKNPIKLARSSYALPRLSAVVARVP